MLIKDEGETGVAAGAHAAERIFPALEALSRTMVARHHGDRPHLDLDAFESLSDHLVIIRTARRFGDFRIQFYGSVLAEIGGRGELDGVEFGDLLDDAFYRSVLGGYRHTFLTGVATITRNHALQSQPGYFTRLSIPIFSGNQAEFLVGAVVPHEQPLGDAAAAR